MKKILLIIISLLLIASSAYAVAHVSATPMPILKPVKGLRIINQR